MGASSATQALVEAPTVSTVSPHMDSLPAFARASRASNTVRIICVGCSVLPGMKYSLKSRRKKFESKKFRPCHG